MVHEEGNGRISKGQKGGLMQCGGHLNVTNAGTHFWLLYVPNLTLPSSIL